VGRCLKQYSGSLLKQNRNIHTLVEYSWCATENEIGALAFMLCTTSTVRDASEDMLKDDEAGRVLQFMALQEKTRKRKTGNTMAQLSFHAQAEDCLEECRFPNHR